jgi:hypothetical protein
MAASLKFRSSPMHFRKPAVARAGHLVPDDIFPGKMASRARPGKSKHRSPAH